MGGTHAGEHGDGHNRECGSRRASIARSEPASRLGASSHNAVRSTKGSACAERSRNRGDQHSITDAIEIDWNRSFASGAVVFFAQEKRIFLDGEEYGGFAVAPTVLISTFVPDTARMIRHEVVHVHQQWFLQESLGRPIEEALRKRLKLARYLPTWLEVGVVAPGLLVFENWASRGEGMKRILEAEAERLERR